MLPSIIIGTFRNTDYKDLLRVIESGISNGVTAFDTAPSYGTERILGEALCHCMKSFPVNREGIFVSDKVDAWQMQEKKGNVRCYVEKAILEMKIQYLDILFIHWPIEDFLSQTWECMERMKEDGLVKDIGICNVRKRHLVKWKTMGVEPLNIQIERHPLRTCLDDLIYCRENGLNIFSYSPLCRMHPSLKNSELLHDLAAKYNKNVGQVILRWHIDSGTIPIFMSKNPSRVLDNIDIFDFCLTQEEITSINSLNCNYKIYIESWGCPGF